MKQFFLGANPMTTLAGYLVAGLVAAQAMMETGETNPWKISIAVGIAILGRVAGDSARNPK